MNNRPIKWNALRETPAGYQAEYAASAVRLQPGPELINREVHNTVFIKSYFYGSRVHRVQLIKQKPNIICRSIRGPNIPDYVRKWNPETTTNGDSPKIHKSRGNHKKWRI